MDKEMMAKCFNEWMRRYIDNPDAFENEWKSIQAFLTEGLTGKAPTYGDRCAAYILKVKDEIEGR